MFVLDLNLDNEKVRFEDGTKGIVSKGFKMLRAGRNKIKTLVKKELSGEMILCVLLVFEDSLIFPITS